ncbi:PINc/VapC family ATPase [Methanobrevibacter filiformis]|uniref:Type II/IV secretion system protein n=1 Tax=Methanobrevibacter filiformis TaxID=55758 RepID=A0A166C3N3_9EURY|nr:PINc/VapC family ATPase [Methanobrevibacter filiformis]KZX14096.1 type II/IV secretion system protein [Methanobrevibacter filiformis]
MEYYDENDYLQRIVPDTSIIIECNLEEIIKEEGWNYPEVIIAEAVLAELEHQANKGLLTGITGLDNLTQLHKLQDSGFLSLSFRGRRPTNYDISLAKSGEIDALIRDIAKTESATLITGDKIQSKVAEAQGIPVIYASKKIDKVLQIVKYFDKETMSVHLKENTVPLAKKGTPGNINLVEIGSEKLSYKTLQKYADEIVEKSRNDFKTFLEVEMEGATVVQSKEYRISIAQPPFSDGFEITIVRPVANVSIDDYKLSEKLKERLSSDSHGILISGSPGAGKSTFAQALATLYWEKYRKIVKTMESPRDLQLSDEITQYSALEGNMENTSDILLLVRPDFTIYDELRKSHDFHIFADMRLAGVGMIGVIHATKPIDAIQRIANRVELGIIPSIVDTSIYIEDGNVKSVYETKLTVKVPSGMKEADLARPVIEVRDFETNTLKNEIYTYGEQTIVMDVDLLNSDEETKESKSPIENIAEKEILRAIQKAVPKSKVHVELKSDDRVNVFVEEQYIPKIIGKNGQRIDKLEEKIGIHISVNPLETISQELIETRVETTKKHIIIYLPQEATGKNYEIYAGETRLFTATVGKKGIVKVRKDVKLSKTILDSVHSNTPIFAKRV